MAEANKVEFDRKRSLAGAFAVASLAACLAALPIWLHKPDHRPLELYLLAMPPIASGVFVAGLCLTFADLYPNARLTIIQAIGVVLMHAAVIVTLASVLTVRMGANVDLPPEQKWLTNWLDLRLVAKAALVELGLLLCLVAVSTYKRSKERKAT